MKALVLSLTALLMICGCLPESPNGSSIENNTTAIEKPQQDESQKLTQWLDEKHEQGLRFSPLQLTSLGRKDLYDQIDDMSEAGQDKYLQWLASTVNELKSTFNYTALTNAAKISYDFWVYQYESLYQTCGSVS